MTMSAGNGHHPVLVVGGGGKTGRRVVDRLRSRDVPVRVGSRGGETRFDWEDPSSWGPAISGASAAYVTYYPDLAAPGAPEAIEEFTKVALELGTRRVVLLSGRGEGEAQRAEDVLKASGAEWTIVRCSWFNQNFSENYWLDPILEGELVLPAGDVPEPFVDADDIADVVAAALTEPFHTGELYELTGPRLLTFADAVSEISVAAGRPISFVPVSIEDYEVAMKEADIPEDVASLVTYLFGEVLDGRSAHVVNGVERALGRQARDFTDYARDTAATGVWNVS